jgi:hypothetical protein
VRDSARDSRGRGGQGESRRKAREAATLTSREVESTNPRITLREEKSSAENASTKYFVRSRFKLKRTIGEEPLKLKI